MATMNCELLPEASLWPEYRHAFDEFSRKVRRIQSMTAHSDLDPQVLLKAAIELEEARIMYNCRRDALAQQLLPSQRKAMARTAN